MALRGVVLREPPVQLSEWLDCIATHPDLLVQRRERREAPKPFKPGTTLVIESKPGDALLLGSGLPVGAIGPSDYFDQDHELLVWSSDGLTSEVRSAAEKVARLLNGRAEWIEDP